MLKTLQCSQLFRTIFIMIHEALVSTCPPLPYPSHLSSHYPFRSLSSSHTSLLEHQASETQAHSHLRPSALAVPSNWNILSSAIHMAPSAFYSNISFSPRPSVAILPQGVISPLQKFPFPDLFFSLKYILYNTLHVLIIHIFLFSDSLTRM